MPIFYPFLMFRKILLEDSIHIPQTSTKHIVDSIQALNSKYVNKVIPGHGIVIKILKIHQILETEITESFLYVKLHVEMIIFQPFEGEILECEITKQDPSGLICEHPILSEIYCKKFFPNTELKNFKQNNSENTVFWCWNYNQNRFIFRNKQKIRCKISKISFKPFLIEVRIDEMGLGPIEWW